MFHGGLQSGRKTWLNVLISALQTYQAHNTPSNFRCGTLAGHGHRTIDSLSRSLQKARLLSVFAFSRSLSSPNGSDFILDIFTRLVKRFHSYSHFN